MPEFVGGLLIGLIIGHLLSKKPNSVVEPPKKDPADWWKEPKEE
jgi:hypothetical protein